MEDVERQPDRLRRLKIHNTFQCIALRQ